MKIAMIAPPLLTVPPEHYGGLERVVFDLSVELIDMGHKVVLYAAEGSDLPGGYVVDTGKPTATTNVDWMEKERKAFEIYKDQLKDFDIVHDHSWWGWPYMAKSDDPDLRVLHTHHGHLTHAWEEPAPVDAMNMCGISRFMAVVYAKIMKRSVHFVYNGVDIDHYNFTKSYGDRLLYVGRFAPFKGAHLAVQVAKKADMPLDLVGGSFVEDPKYIENVKGMLTDDMNMYVDAPEEKKLELMQEANALLFPSKMGEPFGLVGVEANACGTPVVALNDGAIPEVIPDGVSGFICKDVDEMAEAVGKIHQIDRETCRKVVEENFSRRVMAERYVKQYEQVLEGDEW